MGKFFSKMFGKFNSKANLTRQQKEANLRTTRGISRFSIAHDPTKIMPEFQKMWSGKKSGAVWGRSFAQAIQEFTQEKFSPEAFHFLIDMEDLHKIYGEKKPESIIRGKMTAIYEKYVQQKKDTLNTYEINVRAGIKVRLKKQFDDEWPDLAKSMNTFMQAEDRISFDVGNWFNQGGFGDSKAGKKWLNSKDGKLARKDGLNINFAHADYVNELVSTDNVGYLDYDNEYNNYLKSGDLQASYYDGYNDGYNEYNGYNGYNQIQGVDVLFYVLLVICVIIGLVVCSIIGCLIGWVVRGIYGKNLIKNQEDDLDQYQV